MCNAFVCFFYVRWKIGFEMEHHNSIKYMQELWGETSTPQLKFDYTFKLSHYSIVNSPILSDLIFTKSSSGSRVIYTHTTHHYHSMPETVEHRKIRFKNMEESEEDIAAVSKHTFLNF